jgi:hypothetical protein
MYPQAMTTVPAVTACPGAQPGLATNRSRKAERVRDQSVDPVEDNQIDRAEQDRQTLASRIDCDGTGRRRAGSPMRGIAAFMILSAYASRVQRRTAIRLPTSTVHHGKSCVGRRYTYRRNL